MRSSAIELVSLAPFYERFRARAEGLTDEYLWEPVPNCLTVPARAPSRSSDVPTSPQAPTT